MTSQLNIGVVALTYCLTAMAVIPLGFKIFATPYEFWELALAALVGAALYLIPTVGGLASLAGTLGVLYWRLGKGYWTDIVASVGVARLAMLPILLLIKMRI